MAAKFYQGIPCGACGKDFRYVRDRKCVTCCRMRDRARYSKRRPAHKAYYEANKVAIRAYSRAHGKAQHLKDPRPRMLSHAKMRAKKYGRECTITVADIVVPKVCPLLGVPIYVGTKCLKFNSPTIDRKDSSKGYTPGNVWVVSWRANRVKSDATLEEMKLLVKNWPINL